VKPESDTVPTVPDDPPAAGPDRAFEPPDAGPIAEPPPAAVVEVLLAAVVDVDVAVAEEEPHAESPITPHINAAAAIPRRLPVDRNLVGSEAFMMAFLSGGSRSGCPPAELAGTARQADRLGSSGPRRRPASLLRVRDDCRDVLGRRCLRTERVFETCRSDGACSDESNPHGDGRCDDQHEDAHALDVDVVGGRIHPEDA
jgi:hypothetical protein